MMAIEVRITALGNSASDPEGELIPNAVGGATNWQLRGRRSVLRIVPRKQRKKAFAIIFRELGCESFGGRRAAWRQLDMVVARYMRLRLLWDSLSSKEEVERWLAEVETLADRLANTLSPAADLIRRRVMRDTIKAYTGADVIDVVADLTQLAIFANAARQSLPTDSGNKRNEPLDRLIGWLQELYTTTTGSDTYGSGHYNEKWSSAPAPAFTNLVHAALMLTPKPLTKQAAQKAIQRQQSRTK